MPVTIPKPVFIALCLCLAHQTAYQPCGLAEEALPPASQIPGFELPDQYKQMRAVRFPREKITVLTVADKKGSKQVESWIAPLRKRYGVQIEIEGIADMTGVPEPLRPLVRHAFRKQVNYPVMLDWEGKVAKSFSYQKGEANLFILDRGGRVRLHTAGPATAPLLSQAYQVIDSGLKSSERE